MVAAERLTLSIEKLDHPAASLRKLAFHFDAATARMDLRIGRLRLARRELVDLQIECPRARFTFPVIECSGGRARLGREALSPRVDLRFDVSTHESRIVMVGANGARAEATVDASGRLLARVASVSLADVARYLPDLARWNAAGVVDGELEWLAPSAPGAPARAGSGRLTARGKLSNGGFGTPDGQRAAEKLSLGFFLDAHNRVGRWNWSADVDWHEGAAYWHPFFIEAGSSARMAGVLQDDRLEVREFLARIDGVEQFAATATVDLARKALLDGAFSVTGADLAVVGPRWLAPLISPASAERLRFAGRVSAGVRFEAGVLTSLDAVFDEAGFSLPGAKGGGLAFGPVNGHLPWQATGSTHAQLQIGGGRWERLTLGAFALSAQLEGDRIRFDRSVIPVLDGAIVLDGLALRRSDGAWIGSGGAVIEPVSMRLLTEALGLPPMNGVLSASIPALSVRPGEIALDGALVVSVFDGYVQATSLSVREPFGVASHLSADLEARHIDLAQLTKTFSFGSITGFADADVRGLELVRWRPTRFDARIASSPGRYPRRISQRAVQNISALGGAGAMAAIQRSLIGLFDTFGYAEIGFRCALDMNVCTAGGVEGADRADGGFTIVRGGGVPAVDVIGYNRRIDWKELVDRLQRVTAGNAPPEVR